EKGGEATEADIAGRMGVSLKEFQQMLADNNNSQMYSVDELQENFADSWESCGDENESLNPVHHAVRQNLIEQITEHLQYIPELEQCVLQLYYCQDINM